MFGVTGRGGRVIPLLAVRVWTLLLSALDFIQGPPLTSGRDSPGETEATWVVSGFRGPRGLCGLPVTGMQGDHHLMDKEAVVYVSNGIFLSH